MNNEDNKATALECLRTWNTPECLALLSEDFEFVLQADPNSFPWPTTYKREQMAEVFRNTIEEDINLEATSVVAEGSKVAIEVFMTCLIQQKPWSLRCHFAFELREGEITRIREYADTTQIVQRHSAEPG